MPPPQVPANRSPLEFMANELTEPPEGPLVCSQKLSSSSPGPIGPLPLHVITASVRKIKLICLMD